MIPDLIFKGREKSVETLRGIALASLRMRAFPAVKAMEEKGFAVTFGEHVAGQPSRICVGKIGGPDIISRTPIYLGELRQHKERGAKIYVDYTDNHLGSIKPVSGFYQEAIKITDVAVVPSRYMAQVLKAFFGGDIVVIEDALDVSVQPVKENPQKMLTFLWFGHESNIQYLKDFVRTGFRAGDVAKIIVLSSVKGLEIFKAGPLQSNAKLEFLLLN